ncbi:hypothetical protein MFIFM68171_10671 [Madurella fahalii]|uniref:Uncharacterized protein n=1 Tax=Madurella fahalii TaxID=1157608 RepID=A0ABQ0GRV5_9PEZI
MMGSMCYSWETRRGGQLGCILPDREGGHAFIPYDDDKKGLPGDLLKLTWKLESWAANSLSRPFMLQVDKLLEDEVRDKCLPYLKNADPSRLDFLEKVRILAKYRLMQESFDALRSNDPRKLAFRFIISEVTEYGHVNMKWDYMDWKCNEEAIAGRLNGSSPPQHDTEALLPRQIRELKRINDPEDGKSEARAMIKELESPKAVENEALWSYFIYDGKKGSRRMEDQHWTPLSRASDFSKMKRLARERGQFPVFMRTWHLRFYNVCSRIRQLQERQLQYHNQLYKAAIKADPIAKAYFDEVCDSSMRCSERS